MMSRPRLKRNLKDLRKKYDDQINELREQLREKNNEIQGLYKDNFTKDEHINKLQSRNRILTFN